MALKRSSPAEQHAQPLLSSTCNELHRARRCLQKRKKRGIYGSLKENAFFSPRSKIANFSSAQVEDINDAHLKLIDFGFSRRYEPGTPMKTKARSHLRFHAGCMISISDSFSSDHFNPVRNETWPANSNARTREKAKERGSFSSVSTLLLARVGAFFSIFRDLQDCHTFAPLQC